MKKLSTVVFLLLIFFSGFSLNGCGNKDGNSNSASLPPYIDALYAGFPTGSAPADFKNAMVVVREGSSSGNIITTATVIMNGVPLVYNPAAGHEDYEGDVAVLPGGAVYLSVNVGGETYTATGTSFDSCPTISSPLSGSTWSVNNSNTVSWSGGSPTTNAAYALGVLSASDPNGQMDWPASTSLRITGITEFSYSIPENSLTAGNRLVIVAIAKAISITNAASNSILGIGGFNYVPITVN